MTNRSDTDFGEAYDMKEIPLGVSLTDRQLSVYRALFDAGDAGDVGPRCAAMYLSAVQVLSTDITESEVLASHALRELLEKLPGIVGVAADRGQFSHRSRVGDLRVDWDRAIRNSIATSDGTTWNGAIDSPLQRFLRRTMKFFNDEKQARIPSAEGIRSFVRGTDPMDSVLPTSVEDTRLKIWDDCRNYFQAVSHHNPVRDPSDLLEYVALLESFLLDHLRPSTTSDQATIQSIISEAEGND